MPVVAIPAGTLQREERLRALAHCSTFSLSKRVFRVRCWPYQPPVPEQAKQRLAVVFGWKLSPVSGHWPLSFVIFSGERKKFPS